MKYQTTCPACMTPITLGRIVATPTPWHLRCPGCKAKLKVKRQNAILVMVTIAVALIGATFGFIRGFMGSTWLWFLVDLLLILFLVFLFEFIFGLWVTNKDTLRLR